MSAGRASLAVALVLTGLAAGFFFTYQASVTLGLAEVGDVAYVAVFQAINDTVSNAAFGLVFFGTVPALAAALALNRRASTVVTGLLAVALVAYLACIVITGTGNVPLNDDLALVDPITETSAAAARATFEDDWNRLNLVRTLAAIISLVAVAIAATLDTSHPSRRTPPAIS